MNHATDHGSLQSVLLADITCAFAHQPRNASRRRAAARTIFAAVEGILWTLQCELLSAADQELSALERAFLRQETQVLRENGKVATKVSLKQRLVFTAGLVRRLRPECRISFDDLGWESLLSSLDVRDRLIQLKNQADLDITEADLRTALIGEAWFLDNIAAVVQSGIRGYREDIQSESAFVRALSEWSCAGAEISEPDIEFPVSRSRAVAGTVMVSRNWACSPDQSKNLNSDNDHST